MSSIDQWFYELLKSVKASGIGFKVKASVSQSISDPKHWLPNTMNESFIHKFLQPLPVVEKLSKK